MTPGLVRYDQPVFLAVTEHHGFPKLSCALGYLI